MVAHPDDDGRLEVTRVRARWVRIATTMAAILLVAWGVTFVLVLAMQPIEQGDSPSARGLVGMAHDIVCGWWSVLLGLAGVNLAVALGARGPTVWTVVPSAA